MAGDDLANRVEILEKKVEALVTLPGRLDSVEGRLASVELQILQLGERLDDGVSALRVEIRTGDERTRAELRAAMQSEFRQFAEMMDVRFAQQNTELRHEMRRLNDETRTELRDEMRRLNEETNAQARVLYEDLKDAIKRIGEGPPTR